MPSPKGHAPYPGCETGGRPKTYTKEYLDNLADEFSEWIKNEDNYWFKSFALDRDILPERLSEWARENDKFAKAYHLAKHKQEERIFKGATSGKFNAQMAKFGLANCHKWSERSETTISGNAENPLHFLLSGVEGRSKDLVNDSED
jgi:hypothetical protein